MTAFSEFPTFLKAIKAYRNNYSYFLRLRTHPELSWAEKRLLDAKYLIKRKQFRKASDILRALSGLPKTLEAYRDLLISNIHDGMALPIDLEIQRRLCSALKTLGDDSAYFTSSLDLALEMGIQGNGAESLELCEGIRHLAESDWQRANWLRCYALAHARAGDTSAFRVQAESLRPLISALKPFYSHLCATAIAYGLMLSGDLEEALREYERILSRYRSADLFIDRYWALLLKTLLHDAPLPSTPAALRERETYFFRYNIIRSLQCGDLENASRDWKRIQEMRPDHFGESFTMKLDYLKRNAFARCIAKYLKGAPTPVRELDVADLPPLMVTLVRILSGAPAPLRRPQLIEMLYHRPFSPELNVRFYQLIKKAKKAGVPVRNRAGAYVIDIK